MYGYSDINLGDIVRTKTNTVGKVIGMDSVTMVNYDYDKGHKGGWSKIMSSGVMEDEERRPDMWYSTIFLLVKPSDGGNAYIEAADFPDVASVQKQGVTFWSKFKALFK